MARRGILKYKSPEEMQAKVDEYFKECQGHPLLDDAGKPVTDKFGYPIILDSKPLTVTGLALALGFTTRQSLLNYQSRSKRYQEIIERAKLQIENYAEMRLYDKDGSNGAKFNLQNNFKHWDADKAKSDENKGAAINIICDIPKSDGTPNLPNVANMSINPQTIADMQEQVLAQMTGEAIAADEQRND